MIQDNMGLTVTIVFQASSANYGESLGNVAPLRNLLVGMVSNTLTFHAKQFAITLFNNLVKKKQL